MTHTGGSKTNTKVLLGVLVIVLILLAAMMYANKRAMHDQDMMNTYAPSMPQDAQIQEIRVQSSSDEVGDIEADLESTNIDNLDQ